MADLITEPTESEEGEDESALSDDELLEEAKERFKLSKEFWDPIQKAWLEDAKFRALDQWPEAMKSKRKDEKRPCLTVDKCNQYVRQVVNDGRQNRPAVKIRPVDDNGDDEIAEALQGIVRHICDRSNADEAFDTSLDHASGNGYGFFRVLTDYAHKGTFNQEIKVARCRNPISVMIDPNFRAADGSDSNYGFVEDELPKALFKKKYPKAKFTDWASDSKKYSDGWMTGENVRFVEYYYAVETDRTMHLLEDGTSVDDETYQSALATDIKPPAIVESRNIPQREVRWCRLSGAEILEKKEWKGVYVPLIPVFGNESDIEGTVMYSGLIRAAKDAQSLYNFMATAFAERVSMTPKAPYVAEEGQLEGHEDEWKNSNNDNVAVLPYKAVSLDGHPIPPPQRQQASDIPAGYAQAMQHAEHDIQASMGMYNASVGEKSNEKSGKAIMARQREGDTATFHYQDNLNRAIRYLGRILVDLIPKVYDSKRVIRILGEDGTAESAEIDPRQESPVMKKGGTTIYNLNVGTYDVSVAAGPSYTTKRQEALEAQMQLVQSNPEVFPVIGDILVRNADWPGADDIAERLKIMLPPPIQQSLQAKEQGQDPKIEAAIAPLKQGLEQAQQQIQEMGGALQQAQQEAQALKADREAAMLKAQTDQFNAETNRMKAQAEAMNQPLPPEDTSAIEAMKVEFDREKLAYEDSWKKLEAETRILVAQISAGASTHNAELSAQTSAQNAELSSQTATHNAFLSADTSKANAQTSASTAAQIAEQRAKQPDIAKKDSK